MSCFWCNVAVALTSFLLEFVWLHSMLQEINWTLYALFKVWNLRLDWIEQSLTLYRSFRRWSSQPITWLLLTEIWGEGTANQTGSPTFLYGSVWYHWDCCDTKRSFQLMLWFIEYFMWGKRRVSNKGRWRNCIFSRVPLHLTTVCTGLQNTTVFAAATVAVWIF